jgi:large subunit ribosomal protein L25
VVNYTNQRRLKVKALPKNLPDFVEANISELQMGNKLYVTKIETNNFKLMSRTTVVCQVKISRAAMKALKKLQKQKSSTKGKKNNKIYPL